MANPTDPETHLEPNDGNFAVESSAGHGVLFAGPPNPAIQRRRRGWRWGVALAIAAAAFALVVLWSIPQFLAATSARNWVLKKFLIGWTGEAEAGSAKLAWLAPVEFDGCDLRSSHGSLQILIPEIRTSEPFWRFALAKQSDLGEIVVLNPRADYRYAERAKSDSEEMDEASETGRPVRVRLRIEGLQLRLGDSESHWSEMTLDPLRLDLKPVGSDQMIQLEPGPVLTRAPVSQTMVDAGLKFLPPVLAESAWARGAISLELDQADLRLRDAEASQVSGTLLVHEIEAGSSGFVRELGIALRSVFPNIVPQSIRLIENSRITFRVDDHGFWHEGLAFGLPDLSPDLVMRTHGLVRFNQELELELEFPLQLLSRTPFPALAQLSDNSIRIPVRGTLEHPKLELIGPDSLTDRIMQNGVPKLADTALQIASEIAERRRARMAEKAAARESTDGSQHADPADRDTTDTPRRGPLRRFLRRLGGNPP